MYLTIPLYSAQLGSTLNPTALSDRGGLVPFSGLQFNNRLTELVSYTLNLLRTV